MNVMNLESLVLELYADTSRLDREVKAAVSRAATQIKKLEQSNLAVKVNEKPLHDLNKLLDVKQAHVRQTAAVFKDNPLELGIDDSELVSAQKNFQLLKSDLGGVSGEPIEVKISQDISANLGKSNDGIVREISRLRRDVRQGTKATKANKDGIFGSILTGLSFGFSTNVTGSFSKGFTDGIEKETGVSLKDAGEKVGRALAGFSKNVKKYAEGVVSDLAKDVGVEGISTNVGELLSKSLLNAIETAASPTEFLNVFAADFVNGMGEFGDKLLEGGKKLKEINTYLKALGLYYDPKTQSILQAKAVKAVGKKAAPVVESLLGDRAQRLRIVAPDLVAERAKQIVDESAKKKAVSREEIRGMVDSGKDDRLKVKLGDRSVNAPNLVDSETQTLFITIGGYAGHKTAASGYRIAGDIVAESYRQGNENVAALGVRNLDTDIKPELMSGEGKVLGLLGSLAKPNLRGYSKDAVEIAAQAVAAITKNPNIQVKIVGESGGGYAAEEAVKILEIMGYGGNVSGIGIGTPDFIGGLNAQNYTKFLGKNKEETLGYETHRVYAPMGFADISDPGQNLTGLAGHPYENYRGTEEYQRFVFGKATGAKENASSINQDEINKAVEFLNKSLVDDSIESLVGNIEFVKNQLSRFDIDSSIDLSGLEGFFGFTDDFIQKVLTYDLVDSTAQSKIVLSLVEGNKAILAQIAIELQKFLIDVANDYNKESTPARKKLLARVKGGIAGNLESLGNDFNSLLSIKTSYIKKKASDIIDSGASIEQLRGAAKEINPYIREITDDPSISDDDRAKYIGILTESKQNIVKAIKSQVEPVAAPSVESVSVGEEIPSPWGEPVATPKKKAAKVTLNPFKKSGDIVNESSPFDGARFVTTSQDVTGDFAELVNINKQILLEVKSINSKLNSNSKQSSEVTPPVYQGELLDDSNPQQSLLQKMLRGGASSVQNIYGTARGVERFAFDTVKVATGGLVNLEAVKKVTQTVAPAFALGALGADIPLIGQGINAVSSGVISPLIEGGLSVAGGGVAGLLPDALVSGAGTVGSVLSHVPGFTTLSSGMSAFGSMLIDGAAQGITYLVGGGMVVKGVNLGLKQATKPIGYLPPASDGQGAYNLLQGVKGYADNAVNVLSGQKPVGFALPQVREPSLVEVLSPVNNALPPARMRALPPSYGSQTIDVPVQRITDAVTRGVESDDPKAVEDVLKEVERLRKILSNFNKTIDSTMQVGQIKLAQVQIENLEKGRQHIKTILDSLIAQAQEAGLNTNFGTSGAIGVLNNLKSYLADGSINRPGGSLGGSLKKKSKVVDERLANANFVDFEDVRSTLSAKAAELGGDDYLESAQKLASAVAQLQGIDLNALFTKRGGLNKVGKDLMEGLRKGFVDNEGNLISSISEVAESLPDPLKKILGIASPSKVLAEEVGKPIGQGVEVGAVKAIQKAGVSISSEVEKIKATIAKDLEYLEAVTKGDVVKAQSMVEQSAKDSGYDVPVYHGTPNGDFNSFDISITRFDVADTGMGIFTSTDRKVAESYAYSDITKPLSHEVNRLGRVFSLFGTSKNSESVDYGEDYYVDEEVSPLLYSARGKGANSLRIKNIYDERFTPFGQDEILADDIVYFKPNQVKLSDPITKTDTGSVVPLSARFDDSVADIRGNVGDIFAGLKSVAGEGLAPLVAEIEANFAAIGDNSVESLMNALQGALSNLENSGELIGESLEVGAVKAIQKANLSIMLEVGKIVSSVEAKLEGIDKIIAPIMDDLSYLNAVKSGDMDTAASMFSSVAKAKGFDTEIYHGSPHTFNKFDKKKMGDLTGSIDSTMAFFGSSSPDVAKDYMESKDAVATNPKLYSLLLKTKDPLEVDYGRKAYDEDRFYRILSEAKSRDKDSLIVRNVYDDYGAVEGVNKGKLADTYGFFNPNQVKLSDPVTYDEKGRVVPLSSRFDRGSDIRGRVADAVDLDDIIPIDSLADDGLNVVTSMVNSITRVSPELQSTGKLIGESLEVGAAKAIQKAGISISSEVEKIKSSDMFVEMGRGVLLKLNNGLSSIDILPGIDKDLLDLVETITPAPKLIDYIKSNFPQGGDDLDSFMTRLFDKSGGVAQIVSNKVMRYSGLSPRKGLIRELPPGMDIAGRVNNAEGVVELKKEYVDSINSLSAVGFDSKIKNALITLIHEMRHVAQKEMDPARFYGKQDATDQALSMAQSSVDYAVDYAVKNRGFDPTSETGARFVGDSLRKEIDAYTFEDIDGDKIINQLESLLGANLANSLSNSITKELPELQSTGELIGESLDAGTRKSLEMNSPSKLYIRHGKNTIISFEMGVEGELKRIKDTEIPAFELENQGYIDLAGLAKSVGQVKEYKEIYDAVINSWSTNLDVDNPESTAKVGDVAKSLIQEVEKIQKAKAKHAQAMASIRVPPIARMPANNPPVTQLTAGYPDTQLPQTQLVGGYPYTSINQPKVSLPPIPDFQNNDRLEHFAKLSQYDSQLDGVTNNIKSIIEDINKSLQSASQSLDGAKLDDVQSLIDSYNKFVKRIQKIQLDVLDDKSLSTEQKVNELSALQGDIESKSAQVSKTLNSVVNNNNSQKLNIFALLRQQFPIIDRTIEKVESMRASFARFGMAGLKLIGLAVLSKVLFDIGAEAANVYARFEGIFIASKMVGDGSKYLEKVRQQTKLLGGDLESSMRSAIQFSTALVGTNLESSGQELFLDTDRALKSLGLQTQEYDSAMRAIIQISSKGKVSMEELSGQLGEQVPGALQIAADAMQTNVRGLIQMVSSGNLLAEEFAPKFVQQLKNRTSFLAPSVEQSLGATTGRLGAETEDLWMNTGKEIAPYVSPVIDTLAKGVKLLAENMDLVVARLKNLVFVLAAPAVMIAIRAIPSLINTAFLSVISTLSKVKITAQGMWAALTGPLKALGMIATATGLETAFYFAQGGANTFKELNQELDHFIKSLDGLSSPDKNKSILQQMSDWALNINVIQIINELIQKLDLDQQTGKLEEFLSNIDVSVKATTENITPGGIDEYIEKAQSLDAWIKELQSQRDALMLEDPVGNKDIIKKLEEDLYGVSGWATKVKRDLDEAFALGGRAGLEEQLRMYEGVKSVLNTKAKENYRYKPLADRLIPDIDGKIDNLRSKLALFDKAQEKVGNGLIRQRKAWIELTSSIAGYEDKLNRMALQQERGLYKFFNDFNVGTEVQSVLVAEFDVARQQTEVEKYQAYMAANKEFLTNSLTIADKSFAEQVGKKPLLEIDAEAVDRIERSLQNANDDTRAAFTDQVLERLKAMVSDGMALEQAYLELEKGKNSLRQAKISEQEYIITTSRSILDFNRNLDVQLLNIQNQFRDYNRQLEDASVNSAKMVRGLVESYNDLSWELENNILTVQNELLDAQDRLALTNLKIQDAQFDPGQDTIGKRAGSIILKLFESINSGESEKRRRLQEANQAQKEYTDTLRRVRDFEEQVLQERINQKRTLEDLTTGFQNLNQAVKDLVLQLNQSREDLIRNTKNQSGRDISGQLAAVPNVAQMGVILPPPPPPISQAIIPAPVAATPQQASQPIYSAPAIPQRQSAPATNLFELTNKYGGNSQDFAPAFIPQPTPQIQPARPQVAPVSVSVNIPNSQQEYLAKLIVAESGGESLLGQALTARSVLNRQRVNNPRAYMARSNSLTDLINAPNQYQPVRTGAINKPRTPQQMAKANQAISLASNDTWLKSELEKLGYTQGQIKQLLNATGFRTPSAFNDPSQNHNRVRFGGHIFNSDRVGKQRLQSSLGESEVLLATGLSDMIQPILMAQSSTRHLEGSGKPNPIESLIFDGIFGENFVNGLTMMSDFLEGITKTGKTTMEGSGAYNKQELQPYTKPEPDPALPTVIPTKEYPTNIPPATIPNIKDVRVEPPAPLKFTPNPFEFINAKLAPLPQLKDAADIPAPNLSQVLTQIPDFNTATLNDKTAQVKSLRDAFAQVSLQIISAEQKLNELTAISEMRGLVQQTEDSIRQMNVNLISSADTVRRMQSESKGYLTISEEIQNVGLDVARNYDSEINSRKESALTLRREVGDSEELLEVYRQQLAQKSGISQETRDYLTAQTFVLQENIKEKTTQAETLELESQQLSYIRNQAVSQRLVREETQRQYEALKEVSAMQLSLANARYDMGGDLFNVGAIKDARTQAKIAARDIQLWAERNQGSIDPKVIRDQIAMQKELSDINISKSYLDAIPALRDFTSGLKDIILMTSNWQEVTKKLIDTLAGLVLDQLVIKPMQNWLAQGIAGIMGWMGDATAPTDVDIPLRKPIEDNASIYVDLNSKLLIFGDRIDNLNQKLGYQVSESTSTTGGGFSGVLNTGLGLVSSGLGMFGNSGGFTPSNIVGVSDAVKLSPFTLAMGTDNLGLEPVTIANFAKGTDNLTNIDIVNLAKGTDNLDTVKVPNFAKGFTDELIKLDPIILALGTDNLDSTKVPNFAFGDNNIEVLTLAMGNDGLDIQPVKVPSFAMGSDDIEIPNFANGLLEGINKAFAKEKAQSGKQPYLAVLHKGEAVLSTLNGDAQLLRSLKASGQWNHLKANPSVANHAYGSEFKFSRIDRNSTANNQTTIYKPEYKIYAQDADSFRKSQSQIEMDSMARMRRARR